MFLLWLATLDLKSFIIQDPHDRDLLVRSIKLIDVPVLNYVGDDCRHKASFLVTQEMTQLGIHSRLYQVFNAPNTVNEVLVGQYGLGFSYVGFKDADQNATEVLRFCWFFRISTFSVSSNMRRKLR